MKPNLNPEVTGIVLAAGKGSRMMSDLPKVLHPVLGRPILDWVLEAVSGSGASSLCLVLSPDHVGFEPYLTTHPELRVTIQKNRRGTGDAVASSAFAFEGVELPHYAAGHLQQGFRIRPGNMLICAGDVPAMRAGDLRDFVESSQKAKAQLAVLGMECQDPTGYGRLVTRQVNGQLELKAIVEEKDADEATRQIKLCNSGIIYGEASRIFHLLSGINDKNAQKEFYLTDCFRLARERRIPAYVHIAPEARDFAGINTPDQLKDVEAWIRSRKS